MIPPVKMVNVHTQYDIMDIIQTKNVYNMQNTEEDIREIIMEFIYDYIDINPNNISDPEFDILFFTEIHKHMSLICDDYISSENDNLSEDEIDNIINETIDFFHLIYYPYRSQESEIIEHPDINKISLQIQTIKDIPQPAQRTNDWYLFRHNMITASNAYKALESSQAVQNQIIYEKCVPIIIPSTNVIKTINTLSPLHWGQKYEPVAVMVYEHMNNTIVGDFGCVQHQKYSYIGASPDGINIKKTSPLYGRMLEIKCVVSRELTGIPKKEYWVQMQMQMETCNLNECDFFEIKFAEYENYNEYKEDVNLNNNNLTKNNNYKGMIMYFGDQNGNPKYEYMPFDFSTHEIEKWELEQMEKYSDLMWIRNIYWRVDDISNVLVLRNIKWFADNINTFTDIWNTITYEKINGYDHRKPNKRNNNNNNKDDSDDNDDNDDNDTKKITDYYFKGGKTMDITIQI
jgi:putative phage-type endonuclease